MTRLQQLAAQRWRARRRRRAAADAAERLMRLLALALTCTLLIGLLRTFWRPLFLI